MQYNFDNQTMEPTEVAPEVIERAKANALFASKAYQNNWYSSKATK